MRSNAPALLLIALWTILCLSAFAWTFTDDFKQRVTPTEQGPAA